jgi:hypothetical protein
MMIIEKNDFFLQNQGNPVPFFLIKKIVIVIHTFFSFFFAGKPTKKEKSWVFFI